MLSSRNFFVTVNKRLIVACGRQLESVKASARLFSNDKAEPENTAVETPSISTVKAPESKNRPYQPVSLETSLQYLQSKAYRVTYGEEAVWVPYRRNHKGHIPPSRTRETCVRKGMVVTGNPCPICRDEYLVVHPQNVDLLKQFISPHSGTIYSYQTTGVCQRQHKQLLIAFEQAQDMGLIKIPLPYRTYNYADHYSHLKEEQRQTH